MNTPANELKLAFNILAGMTALSGLIWLFVKSSKKDLWTCMFWLCALATIAVMFLLSEME